MVWLTYRGKCCKINNKYISRHCEFAIGESFCRKQTAFSVTAKKREFSAEGAGGKWGDGNILILEDGFNRN